MNWLAHLLLSEPSPRYRLGNLLPDLVTVNELAGLPAEYQRGIACHRRIDAFTDAHPVVRRSKARIDPEFRRYAGVLVDIFYDHVLAREWNAHSAQPLEELLAEFYTSLEGIRPELSAPILVGLDRMRAANWLGSYGEIAGIERALTRLSRRLTRPVALGTAVRNLERDYELLRADFAEFFPELRRATFVAAA